MPNGMRDTGLSRSTPREMHRSFGRAPSQAQYALAQDDIGESFVRGKCIGPSFALTSQARCALAQDDMNSG